MPIWRPKLRRRLGQTIHRGQLALHSDSSLGLTGTTVTIGGAAALRFGMAGPCPIGVGPADAGSPQPIYTALGDRPYSSVSGIESDVTDANTFDVLLAVNLAGGRFQWAPNGVFDFNLYKSQIDRFANSTLLKAAIQRKTAGTVNPRVIVMAVDEPNHPDFGTPSTIRPRDVNDMGLYIKKLFPGAIVYVRSGTSAMTVGWSNISGDSTTPPPPYTSLVAGIGSTSGWSGIDYGFSQYAYANVRQHMIQYFTSEKSLFNLNGLEMIPAVNYWDGGNWEDTIDSKACWDIENDGIAAHFGAIQGVRDTDSSNDGRHMLCNSGLIGSSNATKFLNFSPVMLRRYADIVIANPDLFADAPCSLGYNWSGPNGAASAQWQIDLHRRADFVSALRYCINTMAGRTRFDGWRTPK